MNTPAHHVNIVVIQYGKNIECVCTNYTIAYYTYVCCLNIMQANTVQTKYENIHKYKNNQIWYNVHVNRKIVMFLM